MAKVIPLEELRKSPAETPHGFESAADEPLRIVSVHPSPQVQQTWL